MVVVLLLLSEAWPVSRPAFVVWPLNWERRLTHSNSKSSNNGDSSGGRLDGLIFVPLSTSLCLLRMLCARSCQSNASASGPA